MGKRFTLVELMIVVAIISILAAIAIPNFVTMQYRAKRAELPVNVEGIRSAQVAYDAAQDGYLDAPYPTDGYPSGSVGKAARPWPTGTPYETLGWAPDGDVRGTYWANSCSADGLSCGLISVLIGPCQGYYALGRTDVDGDTVLAEVMGCRDSKTQLTSASDIY